MAEEDCFMMLYIHGFASCGDSNKTRLLKARFGEDEVLSPDIPVDPNEAIGYLRTLIELHRPQLLLGSSLGGYYADFLAEAYRVRTVLINPSTRPYETLEAYVGTNTRWCDGTPFVWQRDHVEALRKYDVAHPDAGLKKLVLLQTGDELLDYRLAAAKYKDFDVITEEGGNHRFENLVDYLDRIECFYRSQEEASQ